MLLIWTLRNVTTNVLCLLSESWFAFPLLGLQADSHARGGASLLLLAIFNLTSLSIF